MLQKVEVGSNFVAFSVKICCLIISLKYASRALVRKR